MKNFKEIAIITMLLMVLIYFTIINSNNTPSEQISSVSSGDKKTNITEQFTKAYVSRIIDGDTIEVTIDSKKYKVRFIGIDCPEYTSKIEYYGKESTKYTSSILINTYIFLEKDVSEADQYGRLLRYVWLEVPISNSINEIKTKMFNGILVVNGYASAVTYPPDIKYFEEFKELAADARNTNMGLWNK
ncbi:MAG: thermonuclease family protein [Clostridia bacterium]|nr:thermonuclease family protein [Clostridia bacterium]MDD4386299.1 thermonuclease family protein [Clostridia bacterium]